MHLVLEGITEVGTDLKGRFVSFKVTRSIDIMSSYNEFSVFIALQGIAAGKSLLGGVSLKDYKIIWKIKMREIKTK